MPKLLIIGASTAGKTTTIAYMRDHLSMEVLEIDGELCRLNGGVYPSDDQKKRALASRVVSDILSRESVVFFANTNYFSLGDIKRAKAVGFTVVVLQLSLTDMIARNDYRVANDGYDDLRMYFEGMLVELATLKEQGLVDEYIDARLQTSEIAAKIESLARD